MTATRARSWVKISLFLVIGILVLSPGMVIAEDESSQCDNGWACIFQARDFNHPNGEGRVLQFRQCDVAGDSNCDWQSLVPYGFNDEMSSWRNKKADDAKWDWASDGSGTDRCMESESRSAYVGDGDNDEASAIKVFNRNDVC
jgi:hypothetical protein